MKESVLNYWREDPLFNEHHEHWHLVYPYVGRVDKNKHTEQENERIADGLSEPRYLKWNNRHGELFAYMHSQLLARYAAERQSLGLLPVSPFQDYREPIKEGYDPGIIVINQKGKKWFPGSRPANTYLTDITHPDFVTRPGASIENQEKFRDRLIMDIQRGRENSPIFSLTDLGEMVEPTDRRLSPNYYGALHNDGHLLIAFPQNSNPQKPGCMFWETTAVRDPVFYRWHAHIDTLFKMYQNNLEPYKFNDLPPVEIKALTIVGPSKQKNYLTTEMRTRRIRSGETIQKSEKSQVRTNSLMTMSYLSHESFLYKINVINKTKKSVSITVRIFMAPEESINYRGAWIEMDKFFHTIPSRGSTILRDSKSSAVIRHPVWTADMLENPETGPDESFASPGCRCGWPYTLLLPRGKTEGMKFRFIAILTSGDDLFSKDIDRANSASYCGLVDSEYPDKRAMGYPFDRPLKEGVSIGDFLRDETRLPQIISVPVVIKYIA